MASIAIIGTGFVADYYITTLANHPELELVGVFDRDPARLSAFCSFHNLKAYPDLASCLADRSVDIIVNLTTPESHFEINCAALDAGKHVYCEKPLAMTSEGVRKVIAKAETAGLQIAGAPANALSEAQKLVAGLIAEGRIGMPKVAYAEMEDGPVFRDNWQEWRSRSGAPWPGIHEFEIGCTLEHAGYGLSWLVALFGPVKTLQAFSALTFPDKGVGLEGKSLGPDFSVGVLEFASGPVARITCGLVAPRDRSLTIVGDEGTIVVRDLWDHFSPVHLLRFDEKGPLLQRLANWYQRQSGRHLPGRLFAGRVVKYPRKTSLQLPQFPSQIDFSGGISALNAAIESAEPPAFGGWQAGHLSELVLALNNGVGRQEF